MEHLTLIGSLGNISFKLKFWIEHLNLEISHKGLQHCLELLNEEIEHLKGENLYKNNKDLKPGPGGFLYNWDTIQDTNTEYIMNPTPQQLEEAFGEEELFFPRQSDKSAFVEKYDCLTLDVIEEQMKQSKDPIHPDHYNGTECLDTMKMFLTREELIGFLKGTLFKYLWRRGLKEGNPYEQDTEKMRWYRDQLMELLADE